jgi:hypothetical protein
MNLAAFLMWFCFIRSRTHLINSRVAEAGSITWEIGINKYGIGIID